MDSHPIDTARDPFLDSLLGQAARLGPEYGGGLSSHLPMALCALRALGAGEGRVRAFFDRLVTRFDAPRDAPPATALAGDWRDQRGRFEAYGGLVGHFHDALGARGHAAVLREALPGLMSGVGAAAFHGLIRTAYAATADHRGELPSALAYWACRWTPLPRPTDIVAPLPLAPWVRRLREAPTLPRPPGATIATRIRHVVGQAPYLGLAGQLVVDAGTLAGLAGLAVERYGASRDFTVLHLVTGSHAMRVLMPWLDDGATAVGHFADAFAAAYLSCGIDQAATTLPAPGLDWPDIVARARASDDEHVIKLVHSCQEEARVHGDAAYRHAAGLVVSS